LPRIPRAAVVLPVAAAVAYALAGVAGLLLLSAIVVALAQQTLP
jgi:hypothetical protein